MSVWDEGPHLTSADGSMPPPTGGDTPAANGPATPPTAPPPGGSGPAASPGQPDEGGGSGGSWWSQRIVGLPAWLLLTLAIAIWVGIVAALMLPGDSDDQARRDVGTTIDVDATASGDPAPATTTAVETAATSPPADTETTSPATASSIAAPVTSSPTTTLPPSTTTTTTTAPATTTTTTPAATTTTTTTTSTTTPAPTTTAAADTPAPPIVISEPVTVTGDDGATLTVMPRRDECRYGPECFVVSFTIDGFAEHPADFVCEFSSGARYYFRFDTAGADPACSTLDVPDSVVVEVGALRSDPVTIDEG